MCELFYTLSADMRAQCEIKLDINQCLRQRLGQGYETVIGQKHAANKIKFQLLQRKLRNVLCQDEYSVVGDIDTAFETQTELEKVRR